MAHFYLPNALSFTTEDLRQANYPEAVSDYAALPKTLQSALIFAWQWVQGYESFAVPTSGSTGSPKLITVSRRRMLVSVQMTQQALSLTHKNTALLSLNPDFIGGKMMLARALQLGMDMVWVSPSAHPLRGLTHPTDFLALVPLQLQTILEDKADYLNRKHAILIGGAPVSAHLEETVRTRIDSPVYSTYGMTETLSHVALRRLNGAEASPYFQMLGDTQLDTDERGCLRLRGSITDHQWLITNDLVEIVDARHFRWQGRYDWVINSGGVKISPEQLEPTVEPILAAFYEVRKQPLPRFFVAGVPDERLGERVVLLVESDKSERDELLDKLKAQLPPYYAPREIKHIATFAETSSGKVDRRATVDSILDAG